MEGGLIWLGSVAAILLVAAIVVAVVWRSRSTRRGPRRDLRD
ncbi:hypothetical protein [Salinarimonas sp.]